MGINTRKILILLQTMTDYTHKNQFNTVHSQTNETQGKVEIWKRIRNAINTSIIWICPRLGMFLYNFNNTEKKLLSVVRVTVLPPEIRLTFSRRTKSIEENRRKNPRIQEIN